MNYSKCDEETCGNFRLFSFYSFLSIFPLPKIYIQYQSSLDCVLYVQFVDSQKLLYSVVLNAARKFGFPNVCVLCNNKNQNYELSVAFICIDTNLQTMP